MSEKEEAKPKPLPPVVNFLKAGLSGMCGTCICHPMDVMKNRMQMSPGVPVSEIIKKISKTEGIFSFYSGLSAGLVRQATYTTTRLGIYNQLQDYWKANYPSPPNFRVLCGMAMCSGCCGAFVGTPAEVALVRMTSDGRLPPSERRNYKNVFDAFLRIAREEGPTTLWRGTVATVGRAAVVNVSQLATYSQSKQIISTKFGVPESLVLHFYASMVSGFFTAFNSMPFDIAKTRIQNSKSSGKPPGVITVIMEITKKEGVPALWRGFWPTYGRIGPMTMIVLILNEQFTHLYRAIFK
ncbi:mitochondrial 2-oxoglutarate/malate carrier protein [Orussus abietinus]|uniref:mitochondrial 2-oxoglutarate/malate carrier protein n=1 Tax=Orussus abietinus TaxID=222816 RepID=UPI000625D262|nr:mitochondrial 2-oxoglutarate/malate carrier protein [Orussus abietinus]